VVNILLRLVYIRCESVVKELVLVRYGA